MINPIQETERRKNLQTKLDNNRPSFDRWLRHNISNDVDNEVPEDIAIPAPFRLSISAENLLLLSQERMEMETESLIPYVDEDYLDDENQYEFSFITEIEHFNANV